jgi:chemotaxis protein CheD
MTGYEPAEPARGTDRRRVIETDRFSHIRRSFDPRTGLLVIQIGAGGFHISRGGEMLTAVLGSCVSACIRDPEAKIGGMNHFLLPGDGPEAAPDELRYGAFLMECLIDALLKAGAKRERLEIKLFGGGNVTDHSLLIGSHNARFARDFLARRGLKVVAEDMEGETPRRIQYFPESGRVLLRRLRRNEDRRVIEKEKQYRNALKGEISL